MALRSGRLLQRRLAHTKPWTPVGRLTVRRQRLPPRQAGPVPHLDYTYFHVLHPIAPYSLLFLVTEHLLLSARLFSVVCSLIMLALIGGYAAKLFTDADRAWRVGVGLGCVVLLVGNPLFSYTYGRAWNHDASPMLAVAGFSLPGALAPTPSFTQYFYAPRHRAGRPGRVPARSAAGGYPAGCGTGRSRAAVARLRPDARLSSCAAQHGHHIMGAAGRPVRFTAGESADCERSRGGSSRDGAPVERECMCGWSI